ncbi:hypothetical protein GCM10027038_20680 [Arthrobacter bambusae]
MAVDAASGKEPLWPAGTGSDERTALWGRLSGESAEDACQGWRDQDDRTAEGNRESFGVGHCAHGSFGQMIAGEFHDACKLDAV